MWDGRGEIELIEEKLETGAMAQWLLASPALPENPSSGPIHVPPQSPAPPAPRDLRPFSDL